MADQSAKTRPKAQTKSSKFLLSIFLLIHLRFVFAANVNIPPANPAASQSSPDRSGSTVTSPTRYIVGWAPQSSEDEVKMLTQQSLAQSFGEFGAQSVETLDLGFHEFRASVFGMTPEVAKKLEMSNGTMWVEPEMEMRALEVQQLADTQLLYNLDLLDGRVDGLLNIQGNRGAGCSVVVLDTGINPEHIAFRGRAKLLADLSGDSKTGVPGTMADVQGHGSHVCGTAGGSTVGVASEAEILMIRVLQDSGRGSNVAVIQGLQLAVQTIQKNGGMGVINMSLGGSKSRSVDQAVANAVRLGIPVVAAAGNESQDACKTSPGGADGVISVGAVDRNGQVASFSNYGKCVTLFAGGVQIASVNSKNNQNYRILSGTSMASPAVAGAACVLMSNGVPPANVAQELVARATASVTGNLKESPNRLLSLTPPGSVPAGLSIFNSRGSGALVGFPANGAVPGSGNFVDSGGMNDVPVFSNGGSSMFDGLFGGVFGGIPTIWGNVMSMRK